MLQDITATTDNIDFPVNGLEAVTWKLAYKMSFSYGNIDIQQRVQLRNESDRLWLEFKATDQEFETSEFIEPAYSVKVRR